MKQPVLVIRRGARLARKAPPAGSSHMSLITGAALPPIVIVADHRGTARGPGIYEPSFPSLSSSRTTAARRVARTPRLCCREAGKAPTFTPVRKSSGNSGLNLHSFLCRFFCVKIESCISPDNHG